MPFIQIYINKIFLAAPFLFLIIISPGQNIDSLLTSTQNENISDDERYRTSFAYLVPFTKSDPQNKLILARELIQHGKLSNDSMEVSLGYLAIGNSYIMLGSPDSAQHYVLKA